MTIAGAFNGTIDLDPHQRKKLIRSSAGQRDAVIWRLDTDGKLLWARTFGDSGSDEAFRVVPDASGNLFVTGPFQNTVNFGTSSEPVLLTSATADVSDTYLLKLNSSGDTLWAKQVTGAGLVGASRLAIGESGAIFTGGRFEQTAVFAGSATSFTSSADRDAYVARWDTNGALLWARQLTATGDIQPQRMLVDDEDNVYAVGRFRGSADVDPGNNSKLLTAPDAEFDGFVVKLNSAGDLDDAFHFTGPDVVRTDDLAQDPAGDILISGSFASTVSLPTGAVLTSNTAPSVLVSQLNVTPGLTVLPTAQLITTEAGGTTQFEVSLDTQPTDEVTINIASSDTSEGVVTLTSLTFDAENWHQAQLVTVRGIDDEEVDGDVAFDVVLTASSQDPDYAAIGSVEVSISNQDDEEAAETSIYIDEIRFEQRSRGKSRVDYRVVVLVRADSNRNGIADASDSAIAGVDVTVSFAGHILNGTTNESGVFVTSWIGNLASDTYYANVDLALSGYVYDPLSLDLEDDSDDDGLADEVLVI